MTREMERWKDGKMEMGRDIILRFDSTFLPAFHLSNFPSLSYEKKGIKKN